MLQQTTGDNNIFSGTGNVTVSYITNQLPQPEAEDRRNLSILAQKVRSFWIDGVLAHAGSQGEMLDVSWGYMPEAVEHPWERVLALPRHEPKSPLLKESIIDVFARVGRSLLILGEPGSGKTTTLLALARDLLVTAESDPSAPVPVVFSLSSWVEAREPFVAWLVNELSVKYQVSRTTGTSWVRGGRLLLLLDGLDEVSAEHRGACIKSLHAYVEEFGVPGLVVTSRVAEYLDSQTRLRMSGAIRLQPFTQSQVDQYLASRGSALTTLRVVMREDPVLQELARSPLMLDVMCITYEGVSEDVIAIEGFETLEARRERVFAQFLDQTFARKGKYARPFSDDHMRCWLRTIARAMNHHGQTFFRIEQLQPSWLDGQSTQRSYMFVSRILCMTSLFCPLAAYWTLLLWLEPRSVLKLELVLIIMYPLVIGLLVGPLDFRYYKQQLIPSEGAAHKLRWTRVLYWVIPGAVFWWARIQGRDFATDVGPAAAVRWSWDSAWEQSVHFGKMAVVISALVGVPFWFPVVPRTHSTLEVVAVGMYFGWLILFGLIGWIVGFFAGGWNTGIERTRVDSSSGVYLTIRNACLIGSITASGLFVLLTFLSLLMGWSRFPLPAAGVATCLLGGFILALTKGGYDLILHYVVRLFLFWCDRLPWRVVTMLDHAVQLSIMQRVGGGYRFFHGLLQSHLGSALDDSLQNQPQRRLT